MTDNYHHQQPWLWCTQDASSLSQSSAQLPHTSSLLYM